MAMTLKEYMDQHGLDDEAFGCLVGRHRTQVLRIRNGTSRPPDDLKAKIAEVTENAVPVTAWFDLPAQEEAA